jgi:hypothetical protein
MKDQAWLEGLKNGRTDRFRGAKNESAWVVLLIDGYSRSYSLGYCKRLAVTECWPAPILLKDHGRTHNKIRLSRVSCQRILKS